MPSQSTRRAAFTLVELLVVIAILGLLAALLFPVLAQTREAGRATRCAANLKQIGLALHLYAEDHDEHFLPFGFLSGEPSPGNWVYWQSLLQPYLKHRPLTLCPSNQIDYGSPAWFSCRGNVDTQCLDAACSQCHWWVSYGLNGVWNWIYSDWSDCARTPYEWGACSAAHHGPFSPWPWLALEVTWASVADPAGTIYVVDSRCPDQWSDHHFDYPMARGLVSETWTCVGRGVTGTVRDAAQQGAHHARFNALFIDGHVKSLRWGTTCPSMWTIQDDEATDGVCAMGR